MRTGVDEEVVFAMDIPALLDAMAKVMLKGPEKAVATASAMEKPIAIWEKELALREQELALKEKRRKGGRPKERRKKISGKPKRSKKRKGGRPRRRRKR